MDLSLWRSRWNRWRKLSLSQKVVLLDAWSSLICLTVLLRWGGFRRAHTLLARFTPPVLSNSPLEAPALAAAVEQAARIAPIQVSCLTRSLALWWLLRRRRIAGELCIGVRKNDGQLQAHAWVEEQGRVLNDAPDVAQRYAAFDSAAINRTLEWQ